MTTKNYSTPPSNTQTGNEPLILVEGTILTTTGGWEPTSLVALDGTDLAPVVSGVAQDGTDGTAPPSIAGTGIRGWLRAIYEKLAATQPVSLAGQQLSTDTVTISASGDNTIHTTTAGKILRLYYLKLSSDGGNSATILAATRIGATTPKVDLTSLAPSQVVAANIGAEYGGGPAFVAGGVSDNLIVNLSTSATIYATIRYLEV